MAHDRFRTTLLATALAVAGVAVGIPAAAQTTGSAQSSATQSSPNATQSPPNATRSQPRTAPPSAARSSSLQPPGTSAATPTSADASKMLSRSDRKFIEKAVQGGVAEVEMGKLAVQKAESKEVKDFGQRMVDDHSKANTQLQQLAGKKSLQLPTDMDSSSRREYDKLQKLSGAKFDREYMKAMVSDHRKDVENFQKEAKSTKDGDLKSLTEASLPTLEEHLKLAQTDMNVINNQARSSASTATPSSTSTQSPATMAPSSSMAPPPSGTSTAPSGRTAGNAQKKQ